MITEASKSASSQTKVKLWIDIFIFIAFLIVMEPHLSDLPVHEWLGLSLTFVMVVHLLLSWDWIIQITKRFFKTVGGQNRINYILNWLFLLDGVVIMMSGIMISREAIPALGLHLTLGPGWYKLHDLSTNVALLLLGLHTALHWNWIVSTLSRYIFNPALSLVRK
jgi:hypothetical protein